MDQETIRLNIIPLSRDNLKISAYTNMFGYFVYGETLLAQPVTKFVTQDKWLNITSWDPYSIIICYTGPEVSYNMGGGGG